MKTATIPTDCLRCGVCCFGDTPTFVRVSGDDWSRLGTEADRLAHFVENRAYMRMTEGHCAALAVRQDEAGSRVFFCTAYERRPQACRALGRGSPECAAELERKAGAVHGPGGHR